MDYILAVFINRAQSQMFSKMLQRQGVPNSLISTPSALGVSCGLSVKFNINFLNKARAVLNASSYSSFKNFYKIIPLGTNKNTYIRV